MARGAVALLAAAGLWAGCIGRSLAPVPAVTPVSEGDLSPAGLLEARLRLSPATNAARAEQLRALFREEGCEAPQLMGQPVSYSELPNLHCLLPGTGTHEIVVGAHFDKVPAGAGVVDNWSGTVLLPSLYRALRAAPLRHTFRFIGFTDEEQGLVGSTAYVQELADRDAGRVRAMVNLDSLGAGPTRYWAESADATLVGALAHVASALGVPVDGVRFHDGEVGADSMPFRKRGIPALTIHSIDPSTLELIDGEGDTFERVDPAHYRASYRLLAAYLLHLDRILAPEELP